MPRIKKMKKPKFTRSEMYDVNVTYMGEEPTFPVDRQLSDLEYGKAINWYNYMCTIQNARGFLEDYFTFVEDKESLENLRKVSDTYISTTASWIARLWMRGYLLPDSSSRFFKNKLKEMFSHIKKEQETAVVIKLNVQDRIKEKANDLIGEIESLIDHEKSFSLYDFLSKKSIPSTYCPYIIERYKAWLDDLLDAYQGDDDQLKEAYKHMTKSQIQKRILFINSIIEDAEKYSMNKKVTRAPRKKKPVQVDKLIQNFKFQKEFPDLKLVSINPEKVVGAQELWTYNTKYKILTVFYAKDRAGLTVKGTSILNYDENTSMSKSIGRKVEEYLNRVLTGGKVSVKKIMPEIKTANVFTNRTSDHTILLKSS